MKIKLNGQWTVNIGEYRQVPSTVPGSVYTALLENGKILDPFWGLNEYEAFCLVEQDCSFETIFDVPAELLQSRQIRLCCHGLDTLATVTLNGLLVGKADNMHSSWEWDVTECLRLGENQLCIDIASPLPYIKKKQEEYPLWGVATTCDGFSHIRKPHYMFGWDWGPQLPDMGIWKPIELISIKEGRYSDLCIRQGHLDGKVRLLMNTLLDGYQGDTLTQVIYLTEPSGETRELTMPIGKAENHCEMMIDHPCLWWPNGYGDQPLYTVEARLYCSGKLVDSVSKRIGLRTLTVSTAKDEWGREFCFVINGCKIFAMGADYVPEDNLLPRANRERTKKLLKSCVQAHFNCIRIWGGGHYATDDFMDLCDEMGLLVWQDFMFACCTYRLTSETRKSLEKEFRDNLLRLQHHASLALLCGNNEMEIAWTNWGIPQDQRLKQDYTELYERMLPELVKAVCPDVFYWPASPSSGGGFLDANGENIGDAHYWEVWLGGHPFEDYRKHYFRFCSEFGFESFPTMETMRSFSRPEDWNPFSSVMENHQKCVGGNTRILTYLSDNYRYPYSFPELVYVSQLLQAEAIQYGVEHFRRHRGRCMGAIYWQLNDCWPAASWSGIDYAGRWKALHYRAKTFFAPVLLSAEETGSQVLFNISNEKRIDFSGILQYGIYENDFTPVFEDSCMVSMNALSAGNVLQADLTKWLGDAQDCRFLRYALYDDRGICLRRSSLLFVKPKHYQFSKPILKFRTDTEGISVRSDCYVKGLYVELAGDVMTADNFVDITDSDWVTLSFCEPVRDAEKLSEGRKIYTVNTLG